MTDTIPRKEINEVEALKAGLDDIRKKLMAFQARVDADTFTTKELLALRPHFAAVTTQADHALTSVMLINGDLEDQYAASPGSSEESRAIAETAAGC